MANNDDWYRIHGHTDAATATAPTRKTSLAEFYVAKKRFTSPRCQKKWIFGRGIVLWRFWSLDGVNKAYLLVLVVLHTKSFSCFVFDYADGSTYSVFCNTAIFCIRKTECCKFTNFAKRLLMEIVLEQQYITKKTVCICQENIYLYNIISNH